MQNLSNLAYRLSQKKKKELAMEPYTVLHDFFGVQNKTKQKKNTPQ